MVSTLGFSTVASVRTRVGSGTWRIFVDRPRERRSDRGTLCYNNGEPCTIGDVVEYR